MKLTHLFLTGLAAARVTHGQGPNGSWPLQDNGLTTLVQWDRWSYHVNGERLFVFSGEFHPWRYPVPELWRDLLEKIRAAGFNTISIYNSWNYHQASNDAISLDFSTGAHNFTSIMTLCKELGMYIIIRPGPYVNAETNAGGFPLWLTTGAYGKLRNDDDRYTEAWEPYWRELSNIVEPHLITNGGNVIMFQIENELNGQWTNIEERVLNPPIANYMQLLQDSARENGIDVPVIHNAPNMRGYSWSKDFSNATGNVDTVGLDSYPSCWSCNLSECTGTNGEYKAYQVVNYFDYFEEQSPSQPNFMPEFQGGSYNPWGGPQGGCPQDIGSDFANLFYRNLISQQVTAISLYMMFGGTNWGWHACPVVATSYDYSSPVSENRALWDKFYETKLLTLFTRVAKDLSYTDRLAVGTNMSTNPSIVTTELRNPETGAAFYVVMHNDSTASSTETFKLHVETSQGRFTIPRLGNAVTIDGHQSKILVTDFSFGSKTLDYSTSEVLSYAIIDGRETLALWLPEGESGEFSIRKARVIGIDGMDEDEHNIVEEEGSTTVSYTQARDTSIVQLGDGSRILLLSRQEAYRFWAPSLTNNPMVPVDEKVLVQGPYLVRGAVYDSVKQELSITGDEEESISMIVHGPRDLCSIKWNGRRSNIISHDDGMYTVAIDGPQEYQLPALGSWVFSDEGLPEIDEDYKPTSSVWISTSANKTETPNLTPPAENNPVLYVDDYGVHYGNHIYRATFPSTASPPTGVFLNITGGLAFGHSVWLNSDYVGSYYGLSYRGASAGSFSFQNATLRQDQDNVLVILMDNSGHDLREQALDPRGIVNATLLGPGDGYSFTEWKMAGNAGLQGNIDPVRGPLNEGSLCPERVGMHLPGYPDEDWSAWPSNRTTLSMPHAGVRVFRTVQELNVPQGLDVSISFRLTSEPAQPGFSNRLRALLYVNGYQYGRFNPYIGNQINYPMPPGILNYSGDNTIVLTLWSQSAEGVEMKIDWELDYVHVSSFDMKFDSSYLRPSWTSDRLQYA